MPLKNKTLIALIISFCFPQSIWGQGVACTYQWHLQLLNDSLKPLTFTEIFIESLHLRLVSNSSGWATLPALCPGSYEVEIHRPSFPDWHEKIQLDEGQDSLRIIAPYSELVQLAVIEIEPLASTQSSNRIWETAGNQSLAEFAQAEFLGVQILQTGASLQKPMVQGLWGLRLPLFQQGIRLDGQSWGLDHAPELDFWNLDRWLLHRGAMATWMAPDAPGAAMDLRWNSETHAWQRDYKQLLNIQTVNGQVHGAGRLNWNRSSQTENAHSIRWSHRQTGNYRSPDGFLQNTAQRESSIAYARIRQHSEWWASYLETQSGLYAGSHIGNLSDLNRVLSGEKLAQFVPFSYRISRPFQQVRHGSIAWSQRSANPWIVSAQGNHRQEFDPSRGASLAQLNVFQGTLIQQKTTSVRSGVIGLNFQEQGQRYGGYYFIPDYLSVQTGIFWHHHNSSWEWTLRLDGLRRWVRHPWYQRQGYILPALGLSHARDQGVWHYNFSSRAPAVNELFAKGVHHGSASYEEGNAQLNTEHIHKIQYISNPKRDGKWEGFVMYSPSFIDLFPMSEPVLTVRGAFPGFQYQSHAAVYAGLSAHVEKHSQQSPWFWEGKGQIIWAQLIRENRYPSLLPAPNFESSISHRSKSCTWIIRNQVAFRQPFYTSSSDFLPPPPAYWRLDLQVTWTRPRGEHIELYLQNALNQRYRNYLDRFRYYIDAPGWNLGLRWKGQFHHHYPH
ncbi:MAG: putative outer rane receptor protein [Bacteroidota bacterium]|jgi:iron complex outermembrane receptor protein